MPDARLVAVLSLITSLAFLLLIWRLVAGYRADNLRDQLFTLRDEMLLYVLDHDIADLPAHENLRLVMNGLIRYAHRVSLSRLLLLDVSRHLFRIEPCVPHLYSEWLRALEALPTSEAQRLRGFHDAAMFIIVRHTITGSPFFWAAAAVIVFYFLVFRSTRVLIDGIVRRITPRVPSVGLLEADALQAM